MAKKRNIFYKAYIWLFQLKNNRLFILIAAGSSALVIDGLVKVGTGIALFRNTNENITNSSDKSNNKRHTPDQEALSDLAKEAKRKGVTNEEADALLEWSEECEMPSSRDDRGKPHWLDPPVDHIHIDGKHIPIIN
ncbi:hypothetical protein KJ830_03820 [bacterium]|nr:hypothetical protein [bacterium]